VFGGKLVAEGMNARAGIDDENIPLMGCHSRARRISAECGSRLPGQRKCPPDSPEFKLHPDPSFHFVFNPKT
jgi:hypothetical protein